MNRIYNRFGFIVFVAIQDGYVLVPGWINTVRLRWGRGRGLVRGLAVEIYFLFCAVGADR